MLEPDWEFWSVWAMNILPRNETFLKGTKYIYSWPLKNMGLGTQLPLHQAVENPHVTRLPQTLDY